MNSVYKTPLFNVYSGCSFSEHFCWPSFLDSDKTIDVHNEDPIFVRSKKIYDDCYDQLIRIASIWYNKLGDDQKSIDQAIKDLFSDEEKESDEG